MNRSCGSLAATALLLIASRVAAQDAEEHYTSSATYSLAFPVGDTRQYVSHLGWAGFGWEGMWLLRPNTRGGFSLAVQDFAKHSSGTTNYSFGSATGEQFRDLLSFSAMATSRWYLRGVAGQGPYLGMGAGTIYTQQSYQLGVLPQLVRTGWHLGVAPEAGIAIPVYAGLHAIVSAKYFAPLSSGRYIGGGSRSFQFVALNIGLGEH